MKRVTVLLIGAGLLLGPLAWAADETLHAVSDGRALYVAHCVQCHGVDGKGLRQDNGAKPVPDLTQIEARDGAFKAQHVGNHINGSCQKSADAWMPGWFTHLKSEYPQGEGWGYVKVRNLSMYLESIQEPMGAGTQK